MSNRHDISWAGVGTKTLYDIQEYCQENRVEMPTDPIVALRYYMEWNGLVGYDNLIRSVLYDLITADAHYLTTTDQVREDWLRSLLRPTERS